MARRKVRRKQPRACRVCGLLPEPTDFEFSDRPGRWLQGICPTCRAARARERKTATAQKLLDQAKTTTVIRDGKEFVVKTLPPKRRGGRR
jgi:hypothetical protein